MKNMEKVLEYKAHVTDSTGALLPESSNSFAMTSTSTDYSETFNEDNPLNWAVDEDKLDDIDSDRS
jgi:hypothetical protein